MTHIVGVTVLKNMQLPEGCNVCRFRIPGFASHICIAGDMPVTASPFRPPLCPLAVLHIQINAADGQVM